VLCTNLSDEPNCTNWGSLIKPKVLGIRRKPVLVELMILSAGTHRSDMFRKDCWYNVWSRVGSRKVNGEQRVGGRIGSVKVMNGIESMIKIGKWFPHVIEGLIAFPMNLIERALSHHFEADNGIDVVFRDIVNNDRRRRGMEGRLFYRGRLVVWGQEDFIEHRMHARPSGREIELVRGHSALLDNHEWAIAFCCKFFNAEAKGNV
jgi:hypothetical protein